MKVYHVTLRRNKLSIQANGLLMRFARTNYKAIWYVHRADVNWAVHHVRQRHECADVCVLYVDIGRKVYRRVGERSLALACDIHPEKILGELAIEV